MRAAGSVRTLIVIRCCVRPSSATSIISEASRRLPATMKARHPEVPWRDIAAIGNILRHEYPAVNRDIVWRIVTQDIRPLATAIEALLAQVSRDRKT
jgi:uncharacterized protein with HEPN domain